jgi:D-aminoacyl-tRNA deacylase
MILIAHSRKDIAGTNIAKKATNLVFEEAGEKFQENPIYETEINGKRVKLVTLKEETIYAQSLPSYFPDVELLIFLSRHSSQSGKPTLSVHTPGNFGSADLGGLPRTLSVCPATAMRDALRALSKFKTEANLSYDVSYECTHHGPSLKVPTMFVELGSSPQQWSDLEAADVVARAAIEAVSKFQVAPQTGVLGIGGPHYNSRFTQMALDKEAVFGHMIPKYALPLVHPEMLQQCVDRTMEKVTGAILDWKGIPSQHKQTTINALEQIRLPYTKA